MADLREVCEFFALKRRKSAVSSSDMSWCSGTSSCLGMAARMLMLSITL